MFYETLEIYENTVSEKQLLTYIVFKKVLFKRQRNALEKTFEDE